MRAAALLLLAGMCLAQDKVKDAYWGYEYAQTGLTRVLALGDPSLLYRGKASGLVVSIRLHESDKKRTTKQWLDAARARKPKGARDIVAGPHWFHYTKTDLLGTDEVHGHAYFARGYQCFEVHATAADAEKALAAFQGFAARDDAPGTLLVDRFAREMRKPRDNAEVLLRAGVEYVTGRTLRIKSAGLAAGVFAQARAILDDPERNKKTKLTAGQRWMVFEYGGMARHREPAQAIEWHAHAEKIADTPQRKMQSGYNLACVCSLAKRIDEAFAALYRAYATGKPVGDSHVSEDRDLENCRRDKRWHAFWRDKVKG